MLKEELLSLIKNLIKIPSVYYHEDNIVDFVNKWLVSNNLKSHVYNYSEDKVIGYKGKNIVCTIDTNRPGITLMLNGHLDTVPVCSGWETNPFLPSVSGGKLYGLGAIDMKSGSATLMEITKYFHDHIDELNGKLILTLVTDEEGPYGLGADALLNRHILPPVDCVISCEPSAGFSDLDYPVLSLGARGCFVYNIDFHGKASHASTPEKGVNAMIEAAKFIVESEKVELKSDPILGKGSFCILKANSDGGACSVPDEARVTVHRHIVSFEDEKYVINEAKELIKKAGITIPYEIAVRPEPSRGSRYYKPYYIDKNNKFVEPFVEAIKKVNGGRCNIGYLASIGDFNYFGTRLAENLSDNPPVFILGPDGGNIHAANEFVDLNTVYKTYDAIKEFIICVMGKSK